MQRLWSRGRGIERRRKAQLALAIAMGLIATLLMASPSQAIDGFESSDGNLVNGGNTDWNDFDEWYNKVVTATGATSSDSDDEVTGFDQLTWVQDRAGNPDDIYGGGVKQDLNCPPTKTGSLGGGGSKFDVDRLYLTHTKSGDDDYLFISWIRVPQNSTTASSHIAYEFNKGGTACTQAQDGGAALISRTSGDKLLVYDFEGGSNAPTLKLLTWLTAGDTLTGSCEVSGSRPCWGDVHDLNTAGVSDAAVNTGASPVQDAIANESLGTVRFGEAGINLSHESLNIDVCDFSGNVTGVARSSGSSGTAQMKDKVGPALFELPGCVQNTTITSRVSLDDHATINGFDSDFTGDHTGTLTFSLYGPADTDCDGLIDSGDDAGDPIDPVYTTTIADIDSGGPWGTEDGDNAASSYIVPRDAEGEYNWVVEYSGDSANVGSDSICGEEVVTVEYN